MMALFVKKLQYFDYHVLPIAIDCLSNIIKRSYNANLRPAAELVLFGILLFKVKSSKLCTTLKWTIKAQIATFLSKVSISEIILSY